MLKQRLNVKSKKEHLGTSLVFQWLRSHASSVKDTGLILGRGTKILHAGWHRQENFFLKTEFFNILKNIKEEG